MCHLDLAGRILMNGQRVDDPHRIAFSQSLQLGDDLAVEIGVLEAEHDQLNRSDGHGLLPR